MVTSNSDIAIKSDVDVVVEATGNPEIGILHAHNAIEAQRHIVMVNVEADALASPELKEWPTVTEWFTAWHTVISRLLSGNVCD